MGWRQVLPRAPLSSISIFPRGDKVPRRGGHARFYQTITHLSYLLLHTLCVCEDGHVLKYLILVPAWDWAAYLRLGGVQVLWWNMQTRTRSNAHPNLYLQQICSTPIYVREIQENSQQRCGVIMDKTISHEGPFWLLEMYCNSKHHERGSVSMLARK